MGEASEKDIYKSFVLSSKHFSWGLFQDNINSTIGAMLGISKEMDIVHTISEVNQFEFDDESDSFEDDEDSDGDEYWTKISTK